MAISDGKPSSHNGVFIEMLHYQGLLQRHFWRLSVEGLWRLYRYWVLVFVTTFGSNVWPACLWRDYQAMKKYFLDAVVKVCQNPWQDIDGYRFEVVQVVLNRVDLSRNWVIPSFCRCPIYKMIISGRWPAIPPMFCTPLADGMSESQKGARSSRVKQTVQPWSPIKKYWPNGPQGWPSSNLDPAWREMSRWDWVHVNYDQ